MNYTLIFKALSDESRLRIINLFVQSRKQLCVCEMVDALQLPQYTVSKALGILRNAGLLNSGRMGTWVYNYLNEDSEFLRSFFDLLKKHLADQYPDDLERLKKRLFLREDGVCVVGKALNEQLEEEYQKRQRK